METKEQSGYFLKIVIAECILVFIILLSVLTLKYFFKGTYKEFKNWYDKNMAADTDISEVLGEEYEI